MPYMTPFLRLVVSGSLYTAERFSWSMSLIPNFANDPLVPETVPPGIVDAVTTFHTNSAMSISQHAVLDLIKLNLIGTDGRYVNQGETVLEELDPPVPGPSGTQIPPQISLAITLGTGRSRGRAHAGRFYPPATGLAVQANGGISPTAQANAAGAAADLISSINAVSSEWVVGVTSDLGTGAQYAVTEVRVGKVLDTIRSRRSSIPEDYFTLPIP